MAQECPVCGNNNTVAKVSGIVAGGSTRTNNSQLSASPSCTGGEFELSPSVSQSTVSGHSELARSLALYPDGEPTLLTRLGGAVLFGFGCFFAYTVIFTPGTLYDVPWLVVVMAVLILFFLAGGYRPDVRREQQGVARRRDVTVTLSERVG